MKIDAVLRSKIDSLTETQGARLMDYMESLLQTAKKQKQSGKEPSKEERGFGSGNDILL